MEDKSTNSGTKEELNKEVSEHVADLKAPAENLLKLGLRRSRTGPCSSRWQGSEVKTFTQVRP